LLAFFWFLKKFRQQNYSTKQGCASVRGDGTPM